MPVIRDQLGHSSLAVTDRYLRSVAPAEVIATMQRRQWAEPPARRARVDGAADKRPRKRAGYAASWENGKRRAVQNARTAS
jgi:hypothetical protein